MGDTYVAKDGRTIGPMPVNKKAMRTLSSLHDAEYYHRDAAPRQIELLRLRGYVSVDAGGAVTITEAGIHLLSNQSRTQPEDR